MKEDWRKSAKADELREYIDKVFKVKKPTMGGLDREIIIDFVAKEIESVTPAPMETIPLWENSFMDEFPAMGVSGDPKDECVYRLDQYVNDESKQILFIRGLIEWERRKARAEMVQFIHENSEVERNMNHAARIVAYHIKPETLESIIDRP